MNFDNEEDMFKIGINKYFEENREQYNEYRKKVRLQTVMPRCFIT